MTFKHAADFIMIYADVEIVLWSLDKIFSGQYEGPSAIAFIAGAVAVATTLFVDRYIVETTDL